MMGTIKIGHRTGTYGWGELCEDLQYFVEANTELDHQYDENGDIPPKFTTDRVMSKLMRLAEAHLLKKATIPELESAAAMIRAELEVDLGLRQKEERPNRLELIDNLYIRVGKLQRERSQLENDEQLTSGQKRERLHGIDDEIESVIRQIEALEK